MRKDERYVEEACEEYVDESAFSEFDQRFADTYFEEVHQTLSERFPVGRMRILSKDTYNCNSWHRDPEPRLHIPIISNPGSLFIVNHHVTHLPADGSVYFTDTRGYHTAINGGMERRVHLVAALPTLLCRVMDNGHATNQTASATVQPALSQWMTGISGGARRVRYSAPDSVMTIFSSWTS